MAERKRQRYLDARNVGVVVNMVLVLKGLSRSINIVLVDINDTSAFRHLLLAILKPTIFAMLVHSHPCSREERTSAAEAYYQARVSAKLPSHL